MDFDLVVVGSGIAGMTAAVHAARGGSRVLVVEKADSIGGSSVLSGGVLWHPKTKQHLATVDPDGARDLSDRTIDWYEDNVSFARSLNVSVGPVVDVLGYGEGRLIDILGYIEACKREVERADGHVIVSSEVTELRMQDGAVVGCLLTDGEDTHEVTTTSVLLATGGFQASPDLRSKYLGRSGGKALLRSNPVSAGGGLALGTSVGGQLSSSMAGFYGHLIAWPLDHFTPAEFVRMSQMQCTAGIVVSRAGRRLGDESLGYARSAQAATQLDDPVVAVIFDQAIYDEVVSQPVGGVKGLEVIDRVREAADAGAHVFSALSIEELATRLGEVGFDAEMVASTIREFNSLVVEAPQTLVPAREWNRRPLEVAPLYAVLAHPAVTTTFGGLRIDVDARVLDQHGEPIPGLYAAGGDAAVFTQGYGGGLSQGATFGRAAGLDSLRYAKEVLKS